MKALYYGTTEEFNIIDVSRCKGYKDFGRHNRVLLNLTALQYSRAL
mgnify:CR=1 FL=1